MSPTKITLKENGIFKIFEIDDEQYYRMTTYSNSEAEWFKGRLETWINPPNPPRLNVSLLKISEQSLLLKLNDIYQKYMFPIADEKKDLSTDDIFIKIAEAIKNKQNFDSSSLQPNSRNNQIYKVVVKKESGDVFLFVKTNCSGFHAFPPPTETKSLNFLLATFKNDGSIVFNRPPKTFTSRKLRICLMKRFFKLVNHLNPEIPICYYNESRKNEELNPILYILFDGKKLTLSFTGSATINESFISTFTSSN
jgi:hypothetical protein